MSLARSLSLATLAARARGALTLAAVLTAACGSTTSQTPDAHRAPALRVITPFAAATGQLPEGVVVVGPDAYVGLAPLGQILRVDLATGTSTPFATLPTPEAGKGFMTGLAFHDGYLYAGLTSFVPEIPPGVYRVPTTGGAATLFASNPGMTFPNALEFDASGDLYVTDSGKGSVFRASATGGVAEEWVTDPLLHGQQDACGPGTGAGFDIGANGIVVDPDAIYVVNDDKATLLRIPRIDGKAGAPVVVGAPDCAGLGGADGLTRDGDGFLVADNRQNKLVHVTRDGVATTVIDTGLDFPATVVRAGDRWIGTSFAFANASAGKPANPALFELAP
ncbi:MAG: hypothetical protein K8W52_35900 [Deltaproteobacteria bacterium]|nr:hypothetical protein [Deltaproteobacteria bacterium]